MDGSLPCKLAAMNFKSSFLIIIFLLPLLAFGQKKNSLSLSMSINPDFHLNSVYDVENEQVISNSFALVVGSSKSNVILYAAIPSGITGSTSTSMPVTTLRLRLNHTTCPAGQQQNVNSSDIIMNTTPALLFKQKKKNKLTANWYYDVKIPPIGYSLAPGDYHYTFQFTLTQQ